MMAHRLEPLSEEELKTVSDEINAVLEKHGCEMGTTTVVQISKRVEIESPVEEKNDNETGNKEASQTD